MWNVKKSLIGVAVAVIAVGAAQATQTPSAPKSKPGAAKTHKVVHSPYARAAAAHATAPSPGNPIKGHTVNRLQGQGISGQSHHAIARPH